MSTATLLTGLSAVVLALFVASLMTGHVSLPLIKTLIATFDDDPGMLGLILLEIRLPRALLAVIVGGSLGFAGAALQGLLRNPLADPGVIGVSSSAGLGAVLVIYFGLAAGSDLAVPIAAMAGAAAAVSLLLGLAGRDAGPLTLILAGVAVNAFAGALISLALNLAPSPYAVIEAVFWLLGSLADRSFTHVWIVLPLTVLGWLLLATAARPLDALSLGEDVARSLGFNLTRVRGQIVLGAACCVGAGVAVSGAIGFVGLVVPHLLRPLVGHEPGRLLIASGLGGAALLLAADMAARLLPVTHELRLGVVTALIGAPFFLHLIVRTRRMLV
ncbi:MAG: ABC transporter permease [Alphaproteobacteria bacterium]|nr:ABC transporter permease [Alphaproteobacteria bacterium]